MTSNISHHHITEVQVQLSIHTLIIITEEKNMQSAEADVFAAVCVRLQNSSFISLCFRHFGVLAYSMIHWI